MREQYSSHEERFWAKTVPGEKSCLLWTAAKNNRGYGFFRFGGKNILAHRWIYETLHGPVPQGLELDHLCRTPRCVNPDHLEAVTRAIHARRSVRKRRSPKRGKTYMSVRFNLEEDSLKLFEEAIEYYQFGSQGDYLRLCCQLLILHHKRREVIGVPFRFASTSNGKEAREHHRI